MAHADDELLSALLDTEADPGEAAHVDTCEQCQARLATLRGASEAVATPVAPVPGHIREAAVSIAVRGVTEVRPRRPVAAQRRMSALSAAAALVVAVAVGGWAISQIGSGSGDKSNSNTALSSAADSATKSATPTGGLGAENSVLGGTAAGTTSLTMAAPPYDAGDIGAIDTVPLVSQRANADLSQPPAAIAAKSTGAASPCPYAEGTPIWQATLTYNGEAAVAHLVKVDDSKQVMQILRQADCGLIASQDFAPTTPR